MHFWLVAKPGTGLARILCGIPAHASAKIRPSLDEVPGLIWQLGPFRILPALCFS